VAEQPAPDGCFLTSPHTWPDPVGFFAAVDDYTLAVFSGRSKPVSKSVWDTACENGPLTPQQVADKMASGHSVYSPSGSEMSMTCEESLYLNAIAEDHPTFEAAEGTVAHSMGELWIKEGERPDHMIGEIVELQGFEIEITDEMLGFVGDFVKLCEYEAEGSDHSESEKRVDISHLTPIPDQGGTMDFTAVFPGRLTVVDLKYGKEKVDAFYLDDDGNLQINKQLGVYASGVFREWDWLYNFQEIKIVISQPRLPQPISEFTIARQQLLDFEEFARERWARTWKFRDELTRTPSVKGCRWCAVRGTCSALYTFLTDATDVFSDWSEDEPTYNNEELSQANALILDPLSPSPFPKVPDPRELTTDAMAKLLRYRKLMENFFNSIERELLDRAISKEEDIPWWKLVESRSVRRLVDDDQAVLSEFASCGLTKNDLYKSVRLSPAQLERVLHTKLNEGKSKGDKTRISLNKVNTMLEESGLTVKPPGQKTLAPRSDNRAELAKDGDVFEDWSEEA